MTPSDALADSQPSPAPRIVSLIASATETIAALGLTHHLVGVSHECDFPPGIDALPHLCRPKVDPTSPGAEIDRSVRELVRDGLSVYEVEVERLEALAPDVIVTQDHCEVCAVSLSDVEDALCSLELPDTRVCSLHPRTLDDVRRDFRRVADVLGVPERGDGLVAELDARLARLGTRTDHVVEAAGGGRPRVALIEWLAPPMVAGGWMPDLCRAAGGEPVIVTGDDHFEEVVWSDVAAADPDHVVLLPCGFKVERSLRELADDVEARRGLGAIAAVREGRCTVLDGDAFLNRPSPRLADSAELLATALHPGAFPDLEARLGWAARRWTPDTVPAS